MPIVILVSAFLRCFVIHRCLFFFPMCNTAPPQPAAPHKFPERAAPPRRKREIKAKEKVTGACVCRLEWWWTHRLSPYRASFDSSALTWALEKPQPCMSHRVRAVLSCAGRLGGVPELVASMQCPGGFCATASVTHLCSATCWCSYRSASCPPSVLKHSFLLPTRACVVFASRAQSSEAPLFLPSQSPGLLRRGLAQPFSLPRHSPEGQGTLRRVAKLLSRSRTSTTGFMQSCAVIGCGPAGMAASTVLRQSGMLVTCFDLAPEPGGIWASNARDIFSSRGCVSPIYPSMRCVLPKELMAFSDVRFDYAVAQFPHHTAVQHYLLRYAAQKGVRCLTRFNTKVESARFDPVDRMWKIISVNVVNGDVMEWCFDKVCVCTGQTQEARFPAGVQEALQGYVREGGEVHHAAHVKDFRAFHKKRVVVVGNGVSAYDYCVELKRMGADVYQSITAPALSSASSSPQTGFSCSFLTAEHWKDMTGARRGRERGTEEVSDMRVAADAVTRLTVLAARFPWLRNDVHAANNVVRKWLRYRNTRLEAIPAVGLPLDNDGRGLRFAADPSMRRSTANIVAEAKERVRHLDASSPPSPEVFLDNIDAVICATGYRRRYPFLHPDVRRTLEEDPLLLTSSTSPSVSSTRSDAVGGSPASSRHGLYLGTVWSAEPSLALVGYQKDLLPPFLLFEAQARFIAYAFTQRVPLPDGAGAMRIKEDALVKANPALADLYSGDGVGLHSAAYFNVLQHELGVSSRETYTAKVLQRHKWLLSSTLVRMYHKCRSMAPLKRREQHLLFSNKI